MVHHCCYPLLSSWPGLRVPAPQTIWSIWSPPSDPDGAPAACRARLSRKLHVARWEQCQSCRSVGLTLAAWLLLSPRCQVAQSHRHHGGRIGWPRMVLPSMHLPLLLYTTSPRRRAALHFCFGCRRRRAARRMRHMSSATRRSNSCPLDFVMHRQSAMQHKT